MDIEQNSDGTTSEFRISGQFFTKKIIIPLEPVVIMS